MAVAIVEDRPAITGGVDTHADVHVAAALDPVDRRAARRPGVPGPTAAGYAERLLGWLGGFEDRAA